MPGTRSRYAGLRPWRRNTGRPEAVSIASPSASWAFRKGSVVIKPACAFNVDGAIAALLCEMEFPPELANAFFIMARIPGLVAHVYEEQTRMKPMRHINSKDHEYDGIPERDL